MLVGIAYPTPASREALGVSTSTPSQPRPPLFHSGGRHGETPSSRGEAPVPAYDSPRGESSPVAEQETRLGDL